MATQAPTEKTVEFEDDLVLSQSNLDALLSRANETECSDWDDVKRRLHAT